MKKKIPGFYMDHMGPYIVYPDKLVEYFYDGKWIMDTSPGCWLAPSPSDELIWDFL